MSTLSLKFPDNSESRPRRKKTDNGLSKNNEIYIQGKQEEELKEALKEAILIGKGELDVKPLSDLWDE